MRMAAAVVVRFDGALLFPVTVFAQRAISLRAHFTSQLN